MKINITLTPAHIHAHQLAVRERTAKMLRSGRLVAFVVGGALIGTSLVGADRALTAYNGYKTDMAALLIGLLLGALTVFIATWLNYFQMRDRLAKPDGPAFQPHDIEVRDDALHVSSGYSVVAYRWSAFDAFSEYPTILVLWLEPAMGLVIPRSAFADEAAERAFAEAVRSRLTPQAAAASGLITA